MVLSRPITLFSATLQARSKINVAPRSKTATLSGIISGKEGLVVEGVGTLVLSGDNTYTGRTDLLAGTLKISKDRNLGALATPLSPNQLLFDGGLLIVSQGFELSRGLAISKTKTAVIQVDQGNLRVTKRIIETPSVGAGEGSLEKRGGGTLSLEVANDYGGKTTIKQGTVQISAANHLGRIANSNPLSFEGEDADTPTLRVGGTIADFGRNIEIPRLGSKATIDVAPSFTLTLPTARQISGRGKLIKKGKGRMVLQADNTYEGGTECAAGTLSISKDLNLGHANGDLELKGGTLEATETLTMPTRAVNVSSGKETFSIRVSGGKILTITNKVTTPPEGGTLKKLGLGTLTFAGGVDDRLKVVVKGGIVNGVTHFDTELGDQISIPAGSKRTISEGEEQGDFVGEGGLEKTGSGEVVLSGDNTFKGDLTIKAGTLSFSENHNLGAGSGSIQLDGGELLFTGTANLDMRRGIATGGNSTLNVKEKGTVLKLLSLGGLAAHELTKKGSGTLFIEGSLFPGKLIVEEGLFKGKGRLDQVMIEVRNGAAVRPGGSRGDLKVKSYTQKTGGELQIELHDGPKAANKLEAADRINFEPGTRVALEIQGGVFKKGDKFPFLKSTGGPIGGWEHLQLVENHPLDFVIEPVDPKEASPKELQIVITESKVIFPIPVKELRGRARSVAEYISASDINNLKDLETLLAVLVKLPRDQIPPALVSLSPAQFGGSALSLLQSSVRISSALIGPLSQHKQVDHTSLSVDRDRVQTVWATPFGYYYDQKEKGEVLPFRDRTYGFAGGYQRTVLGSFLASVGLGYAYSDLSWLQNRGYGVLQSIYLGPSFGYKGAHGHLCLTLLGGMSFYDMRRRIEFGGADRVDRKAENKHMSYNLLASLNGGLKFQIFEKAQKGLFVASEFKCDALNIFEKGFEESGASDVSLKVKKGYLPFLRPEVKFKLIKEVDLPGLKISPQISVGFLRNIPLNRGDYRGQFLSLKEDGRSFAVRGYRHLSNQLSFGAGFKLSHQGNYALSFDYSANLSYQLAIQEAKLQFSWKF